jgi:Arm DNA-binding domain
MRSRLKDSQVKAAKEPGRYSDGDVFYLLVAKGGSKSWVFMWTRVGKRHEMGLGSAYRGAAPVSLAQARVKADEIRDILASDKDPFTNFSSGDMSISHNFLLRPLENTWQFALVTMLA